MSKEKNINKVLEQLMGEIKYEQQPDSYKFNGERALYRLYGKAEMLLELELITPQQFMEINHETIYFINTTGIKIMKNL